MSVPSGRRREPTSHVVEDHALNQIAKEAECRLAARRQARTEAREIRMRELERQQKEAEENVDKIFDIHNAEVMNKSTRICMPNNRNTSSVSSPASGNSYQSSRRSSEDSLEDNFNYRDVKQELKELEEKFRRAMIQNAQLDNEKSAATYQVEAYKDKFEDMEVTFNALQQEHKDKCREHDQLKRLLKKQQEDLEFYKANLEERDKLIEEEGLVIVEVPDDEKECKYTNGLPNEEENNINDISNGRNESSVVKTKKILVSSESADMLQIGEGSIDTRLKRFAKERADLQDEISKLKIQIEEEKRKLRSGHCFNSVNGADYEEGDESQIFATEEACRLVGDYKFKWQKAEQDISTLQANVARLESQVIRYKSAAESSEKVEDELKVEKRKLQRELREAQSRVEELETANTHLQRRLDKLKNAKSTLLKEL